MSPKLFQENLHALVVSAIKAGANPAMLVGFIEIEKMDLYAAFRDVAESGPQIVPAASLGVDARILRGGK